MDKSNVKVPSNIYPFDEEFRNDINFLHKVDGAPAIRKMLREKNISLDNRFPDKRLDQTLTDFQKSQLEYEYCARNKFGEITKGDSTWGAVLKGGKLEWVCRCIEKDCIKFNECRKDFSNEELKHVKENERLKREKKIAFIPKQYISGESDHLTNENKKDSVSAISPKSAQMNADENKFEEKSAAGLKEEKIELTTVSKPGTKKETGKEEYKTEDYVDQVTVIKASESEKILVNAGPGTGKTYTLIERLKYLVSDLQVEPNNIMVLCFSRAAVSEIKNRLSKAIINEEADDLLNIVEIRTFDSFATWFIRNIDKEFNLAGKTYDERITEAIRFVRDYGSAFSDMKHFFVDEIQDLVGVRAELVKSILENINCGFTILGDQCQSIYDYQVREKKGAIDSVKFYKWLRDNYKNKIKVAEFGKNQRQSRELSNLTYKLRQSILNDAEDKQKQELKKLFDKIGKISYMNRLEDYIKKSDSLCFLCESNGEVLKVSEDLRTLNIKHGMRKLASEKYLHKWIGAVFGTYAHDVMFLDEFARRYTDFMRENSNGHIKDIWEKVKSVQARESEAILIKDLVKGLQENDVPSELFISYDDKKTTVSTIHRAKGKEFDTVVLLRNYYDAKFAQGFEKQIFNEEIKKYYVAFTRPKQELYLTNFRDYRIRKIDDESGRHYETDFNSYRQSVKRIEFGKAEDIDPTSFVSLELFGGEKEVCKNQEYILKNVKQDDPIILRMNAKNDISQGYLIYHISSNGEKCIGKTSKEFIYEIYRVRVYNKYKRALKDDNLSIERYFKNPPELKFFPQYLDKVYVENIVTYNSNSDALDMPQCYMKNGLWIGITIVGFARFGEY